MAGGTRAEVVLEKELRVLRLFLRQQEVNCKAHPPAMLHLLTVSLPLSLWGPMHSNYPRVLCNGGPENLIHHPKQGNHFPVSPSLCNEGRT